MSRETTERLWRLMPPTLMAAVALLTGCRATVAPRPHRVALLDLTDEALAPGRGIEIGFGQQLSADDLRRVLPTLVAASPQVVIVRMDGTWLTEPALEVAAVLEREFETRFRTVGWLEQGYAGALIAALPLNELYVQPATKVGALAGGDGTHLHVEEAKERVSRILTLAKLGVLPEPVAGAMAGVHPLSVDAPGQVVSHASWRTDEGGDRLLATRGQVMVVPAMVAADLGMISGLAATLDELTTSLGLGEIVWVGAEAQQQLCDAVRRSLAVGGVAPDPHRATGEEGGNGSPWPDDERRP
jgi:hypothetical protein